MVLVFCCSHLVVFRAINCEFSFSNSFICSRICLRSLSLRRSLRYFFILFSCSRAGRTGSVIVINPCRFFLQSHRVPLRSPLSHAAVQAGMANAWRPSEPLRRVARSRLKTSLNYPFATWTTSFWCACSHQKGYNKDSEYRVHRRA